MSDIQRAAQAIIDADIMLLATGAGFSADSGLGLYQDAQKVEAYLIRNLSYMDLCSPGWNYDDPATFYGFWGKSMNNYRAAIPHTGYEIVKKWRDNFFSSSSSFYSSFCSNYAKQNLAHKSELDSLPGPFFVYTSNVDALHTKAGFKPNEIFEIHGSIENWQCSKPCQQLVWPAPADFVFKVDDKTMLAHKEPEKSSNYTDNNGFVSNHPRCPLCGGHSRPSIMMFGDFAYVCGQSGDNWYTWKSNTQQMLQNNKHLRVVVLDIGCGKKVASVRRMSEIFVDNFPEQSVLIRINRDYIDAKVSNPKMYCGLKGDAKHILQQIDEEIEKIMAAKLPATEQTNLQYSSTDTIEELDNKFTNVNLTAL